MSIILSVHLNGVIALVNTEEFEIHLTFNYINWAGWSFWFIINTINLVSTQIIKVWGVKHGNYCGKYG